MAAAGRGGGRPRGSVAARRAQARAGFWLASPAAILLAALLFVPSALVLALSVTDYEFGMSGARFIGLDNYVRMLSDAGVRHSVANTCIYLILVAPLSIGLGLWLAVVIEAQGTLRGLWRTVFFLPVTATLVAMATAWEVLLHPTFGLVNNLLDLAGADKVRFLSDPDTALATLAAIGVWKQVGYNVLLFTAGLATIPRDLYEAGSIDGADRGWRRFTLVTWPMLGPVTLFVAVLTLIRAVSEFETVAVLTGGGPVGSTQMIQFTLFEEAFRYFQVGLASAIAVSVLVVLAAVSIAQTWLMGRTVHHAD